MWFLLGLLCLVVSILGAYWLRRPNAWRGNSRQLVLRNGQVRTCFVEEVRKRGRVVRFRIGIVRTSSFPFRLLPEGRMHRWGKRLGLGVEQTVGNGGFDDRFFLEADDPRLGQSLSRDLPTQVALMQMAQRFEQRGESMIAVNAWADRLWLEVRSNLGLPDAVAQGQLIELLSDFDRSLSADPQLAQSAQVPFQRYASIFLAISTGLGLFGLLGLFRLRVISPELDAGVLWKLALVLGLVLTFGLTILAFRCLRQSSRAAPVMVELLSLGAVGAILSCHALLTEFNRDFDAQAATVYEPLRGSVSQETYRCGKRGQNTCTSYALEVTSEVPQELRAVKLTPEQYSELIVTRFFRIEVKPGAVGSRWIKAISASTLAPGS